MENGSPPPRPDASPGSAPPASAAATEAPPSDHLVGSRDTQPAAPPQPSAVPSAEPTPPPPATSTVSPATEKAVPSPTLSSAASPAPVGLPARSPYNLFGRDSPAPYAPSNSTSASAKLNSARPYDAFGILGARRPSPTPPVVSPNPSAASPPLPAATTGLPTASTTAKAGSPTPPAPALQSPSTASSANRSNPMSVSSMLSGPPSTSTFRPSGTPPTSSTTIAPKAPSPSMDSQPLPSASSSVNRLSAMGLLGPNPRKYPISHSQASSHPHASARPPTDQNTAASTSVSASSAAGITAESSIKAGDKETKPTETSSSNAKAEQRAYPPLPSAFARENPYSPWPMNDPATRFRGASGSPLLGMNDDHPSSAASASSSTPAPSGTSAAKPGSYASHDPLAKYRASHPVAARSSYTSPFPWSNSSNPAGASGGRQSQGQSGGGSAAENASSHVPGEYSGFYGKSMLNPSAAPGTGGGGGKLSPIPPSGGSGFGASTRPAAGSGGGTSSSNQPQSSKTPYSRFTDSSLDQRQPQQQQQQHQPQSTTSTMSTVGNGHHGRHSQLVSSNLSHMGGVSGYGASTSSEGHKRRRSDGEALHSSSLPNPPTPQLPSTNSSSSFSKPPPPVAAAPPAPKAAPFTQAQARRADLRTSLVKVDNDSVLSAVRALSALKGSPFLGRVVYCPHTNPAVLLDGARLAQGVGGTVEVALDAKHLLEGVLWQVGDPAKYEGESVGGREEMPLRISARMWDLEGLKRRKVWGTDVYTDDSDVLAMCLHSGWLRVTESEPGRKVEEGEGKTLLVRLRVAPPLLRYHGAPRQGLLSRSWGNGHDGVSLYVEDIKVLDNRVSNHGRRWLKIRAGEIAQRLSKPSLPVSHTIEAPTASTSSTPPVSSDPLTATAKPVAPTSGDGGKEDVEMDLSTGGASPVSIKLLDVADTFIISFPQGKKGRFVLEK